MKTSLPVSSGFNSNYEPASKAARKQTGRVSAGSQAEGHCTVRPGAAFDTAGSDQRSLGLRVGVHPDQSKRPLIPTVSVIGSGAVGSSVAILLEREHMRTSPNRPINIVLIDPRMPGPGLPYTACSQDRDKAEAYWLNQPNNRMSFDPSDVDEFCRFIEPKNPASVENAFSTRVRYGEFLIHSVNQAKEELIASNSQSNMQWIQAEALDVTSNKGKLSIECRDGLNVISDFVVLATGHDRSDILTSFAQEERYFDSPCDLDALGKVAGSKTEDVLVVGTSQSQIDAIAALEAVGFEGNIHSISRRNILPWKFDPVQHPLDFDSSQLELNFFSEEHILGDRFNHLGEAGSVDRLNALLDLEKERAEEAGIGLGFIFSVVLSKMQDHPASGAPAFVSVLQGQYGNPTPPERFSMLEQLKEEGRLSIHKGTVSDETLAVDEGGQFHLSGVEALEDTTFMAVINGATFARHPQNREGELRSPLMARLAKRGLVDSYLKSNFQSGDQGKGLFIANGPNTNLKKWGIETFRDKNAALVSELHQQSMQKSAEES